jgi:hypothetical protein
MQRLSELRLPDLGARASYVVEIWDEGSEQSVVIESTEPLAGYNLEAAAWGHGEPHPDAVVTERCKGLPGCASSSSRPP